MCAFRFGNSRGVTVTKFVIVPVVGRRMMWIIFFVCLPHWLSQSAFFFLFLGQDRNGKECADNSDQHKKKTTNAAFQSHVDDSLLAE